MRKNQLLALLLAAVMLLAVLTGCAAKTEPAQEEPAQTETAPEPEETAPAEEAAPAEEPEAEEASEAVTLTDMTGREGVVKQVEDIMFPVGRMDGDSLPVSAFLPHVDGQFEQGAAAYEKRGVAVAVPEWDATKCIQCGNCAYVCPHTTYISSEITNHMVYEYLKLTAHNRLLSR